MSGEALKLKAEIERTLGLPADSMEIRWPTLRSRAMVCYRPNPDLPPIVEIEIYLSDLDGGWQVGAVRDSISSHFWDDLKTLKVSEKEET